MIHGLQCKNCLYWADAHSQTARKGPLKRSTCMVDPPHPGDGRPQTEWNDWCGKWVFINDPPATYRGRKATILRGAAALTKAARAAVSGMPEAFATITPEGLIARQRGGAIEILGAIEGWPDALAGWAVLEASPVAPPRLAALDWSPEAVAGPRRGTSEGEAE